MKSIPRRLELGKKYYIDINRYYIFYGYNAEKGKYYGDYITPNGYCSTATIGIDEGTNTMFEHGDHIEELIQKD